MFKHINNRFLFSDITIGKDGPGPGEYTPLLQNNGPSVSVERTSVYTIFVTAGYSAG